MHRILITGSNGLLGQKLIDLFKTIPQVDFIATSLGENRYPSNFSLAYRPMDITNKDEVFSLIQEYRPTAIINTAAMTNVDACEINREQCWKLNVTSVEYLLEAIQTISSSTQLVHLSTDFIFDGTSGPYSEEDSPNPLSYYGVSKWEAEKRILESGHTHYSILRTIIVYGVVHAMSRSNIVLWAKSALEKGEKINVVTDQYRMPTLAEDLAMACWKAIDKQKFGTFHISGKDYMSVLEMVQRIARFFKLNEKLISPITSLSLNQPAKRPLVTGFKLYKAIHELEYSPHSFEEGLELVSKQLKK